jgi:hypothetical protein
LELEKGWLKISKSIVCICLQGKEARFAAACDAMHRWGLCRIARFYRPSPISDSLLAASDVPTKHRGSFGCWESHRAIARHHLAKETGDVLILEDDFEVLGWVTPGHLRRAARLKSRLPIGWEAFYLGHLPMWGIPYIGTEVFRTASGCTHAYVLSLDGQRRLAARSFVEAKKRSGGHCRAIDLWMADTFRQYALFPQLVVQSCANPSDVMTPDKSRARPLVDMTMRVYRRASHLIDITILFVLPTLFALLLIFCIARLSGFQTK